LYWGALAEDSENAKTERVKTTPSFVVEAATADKVNTIVQSLPEKGTATPSSAGEGLSSK